MTTPPVLPPPTATGGDDPTVIDPTMIDPTVADPAGATPAPDGTTVLAAPDAPSDARDPRAPDEGPGDRPPGGGSSPPPTGPPPPSASSDGPVPAADGPADRRLHRATDGGWLGGVAQGIARHLDVEPTVVRVVIGLAGLASFGLVASLYGAAWLLLPDEHEDEGPGIRWYVAHQRDRVALALALLGAIVLAGALAATSGGWWDGGGGGWFAGVVVVGAAVLYHRQADGHRFHPRRTGRGRAEAGPEGGDGPAAPTVVDPVESSCRRRHRRVRNGTLLAATATGATAAALWGTGAWDVSGWVVPAVVLLVLVLGLATAPWVGWSWTLTGAALVVLPFLVLAAVPGVSLRGGVGVRVHEPQTIAELRARYQLGIGDLDVDLTDLDLNPGTTTEVAVGIGIGEATVQVPAGVDVVLRGHVSGGTVLVDGEDIDVRGADVDFERSLPATPATTATGEAAAARLVVDVQVGFGQFDLRQSDR